MSNLSAYVGMLGERRTGSIFLPRNSYSGGHLYNRRRARAEKGLEGKGVWSP